MFKFLLPCLISAPVLANEASTIGVSSGSYVQAVLALGFIIAVLLGITWLARKINGGKGFGEGGMRVVGGVALGPRERIVLVEIGDQCLVIGIVPGQIRTLHTLPKIDLPAPSNHQSEASFAQWLKTVSDKRKHD